MRRYIRWKKLLPTLITFLVVSYFAVQFVAVAGDGVMKIIYIYMAISGVIAIVA